MAGKPATLTMNEEKWLSSVDPDVLLKYLSRSADNRKLRLYAVACCRRIWDLIIGEYSREAVLMSERFADGRATKEDLSRAQILAQSNSWGVGQSAAWNSAMELPFYAARYAAQAAASARAGAGTHKKEWGEIRDKEKKVQADLLREIFPFSFVKVETEWLTWHDCTVPRMADGIYWERRYEDLPILADALEEAGCEVDSLLSHLRGGGAHVHVRGCWALDILRGV